MLRPIRIGEAADHRAVSLAPRMDEAAIAERDPVMRDAGAERIGEEDDVTGLFLANRYLGADAVLLRGGTRERDPRRFFVNVGDETGAIPTSRCGTAVHVGGTQVTLRRGDD